MIATLRTWLSRVLGLFGHRWRDEDLGDDIAAHLDLLATEHIRNGLPPAEAAAAARRDFGGIEPMKEVYRDRRGLPIVEQTWHDVRYALRQMRRNKGFAAAAILTLSIGIGASSAIFSIVNAVLIRPLPYGHPERLVYLGVWNPRLADLPIDTFTGIGALAPSYADFSDLKKSAHSFSSLATFAQSAFNLSGDGIAERIDGAQVDGNFFHALQVTPELGRALGAEDTRSGAGRVAVISDDLWQSRFGREPGILGRDLTLDGVRYTIVGVMPDGFHYPTGADLGPGTAASSTDVWTPLVLTAAERAERNFPDADAAIGRLRPGVTIEQAQAETGAIIARLGPLHAWPGWTAVVKPFAGVSTAHVRPLLSLLLGAVFLVLLIACSNAAHLLLARGTSRTHEIGVRAALGAARGRLVRQLLTEAMVLAVAAGALGLLVAELAIHLLPLLDPGNIPRLAETSLDWRVLLFSIGVSCLTGIVFGILPALKISGTADAGPLARSASGARVASLASSRYVGRLLSVFQVGLAVLLVLGSTLLIRSYVNVEALDPGFSASTLTMRISLDARYRQAQQRRTLFSSLLREVRNLPGVQAAGGISTLPLSHSGAMSFFAVDGFANQPKQVVMTPSVSTEYFEAMGARLLAGRLINDADVDGRPPVVVVNEAFARRYFGGRPVLGGRFRVAGDPPEPWSTIVGVVADERQTDLEDPPPPQVYRSYLQGDAPDSLFLAVRTRMAPSAAAAAVRSRLKHLDPSLALADIRPMAARMSEATARRRFQMLLLTMFGACALLLAGIGLYGLMAYSVRQRRTEIGIRVALGADAKDVLVLVIGEAVTLTVLGLLAGAAAALPLTKLLTASLYGITPADPTTFIVTAVFLIIVAMLACCIPARRALRIDPAVALKAE